MEQKFGGTFSLGFYSLQLQLKGLLQESGGDKAVELLDALSHLGTSEQQVVLDTLVRLVNRVRSGDVRLVGADDKEVKALEDGLYSEIASCMHEAALAPKLEVVNGGKSKPTRAPIDLSEVRKNRRAKDRPLFN